MTAGPSERCPGLVRNVYPVVVQVDQYTGNHTYGIRFGNWWSDVSSLPALAQVLTQQDLDEVRAIFEARYAPPDVDEALQEAAIGAIPGTAGYAATAATSEDADDMGQRTSQRAAGDLAPQLGLARDVAGMGDDLINQRQLRDWNDGNGDTPPGYIEASLQHRVDQAHARGRGGEDSRTSGQARTAWYGLASYLRQVYGHTARGGQATMSRDD